MAATAKATTMVSASEPKRRGHQPRRRRAERGFGREHHDGVGGVRIAGDARRQIASWRRAIRGPPRTTRGSSCRRARRRHSARGARTAARVLRAPGCCDSARRPCHRAPRDSGHRGRCAKSSGTTRELNRSVDALSRESAVSSWFCRRARRSSASNQRDSTAMLTGMSIASVMMQPQAARETAAQDRVVRIAAHQLPMGRALRHLQRRPGIPDIAADFTECGAAQMRAASRMRLHRIQAGFFLGDCARERLRGADLRELADAAVGVAIRARAPRRGRTEHRPGHGLRGNGAQGFARTREQWVDERREDAAGDLERPQSPCADLTADSAAGCRPMRTRGRSPPLPSRPWCAGRTSSNAELAPTEDTTTKRVACAARAARANNSTASTSASRNASCEPASAIVVPMQQNASWATRPLSCSAMRSKITTRLASFGCSLPKRRRVSA